MKKFWSWRSLQKATEFWDDCDKVPIFKFAPMLAPVLLFVLFSLLISNAYGYRNDTEP